MAFHTVHHLSRTASDIERREKLMRIQTWGGWYITSCYIEVFKPVVVSVLSVYCTTIQLFVEPRLDPIYMSMVYPSLMDKFCGVLPQVFRSHTSPVLQILRRFVGGRKRDTVSRSPYHHIKPGQK